MELMTASTQRHNRSTSNTRRTTVWLTGIMACLLLAVVVSGMFLDPDRIATHPEMRNQAPSLEYWFGTDWLGRDMFVRTIKGLSLSMQVGLLAASSSTLLAVIIGVSSGLLGKTIDRLLTWLIDLFLSVPHLVTLMLIAFACGGGLQGVVIGIALTHWPTLARVIRAEVLQVRSADYVQISRRFGKSRWWIATRHMLPHLLPQIVVGFLLMFPHAILHEASITFLGLGLSPDEPAIGIILHEAMQYLSTGLWWLAIFPGLGLVMIVRAFAVLGDRLRMMWDTGRMP